MAFRSVKRLMSIALVCWTSARFSAQMVSKSVVTAGRIRTLGTAAPRIQLVGELAVTMFEFRANTWRTGSLFVQGLPIPDTAAQELRPCRNSHRGSHPFGKQLPQCRLVPAQIMAGRVSVFSNRPAKPLDLDDQLITR